jgi:hypothetical protein
VEPDCLVSATGCRIGREEHRLPDAFLAQLGETAGDDAVRNAQPTLFRGCVDAPDLHPAGDRRIERHHSHRHPVSLD